MSPRSRSRGVGAASSRDVFLLYARKMSKNKTSHYRISSQQGKSSKLYSDGYMGKLRAMNFKSTAYVLYNNADGVSRRGSEAKDDYDGGQHGRQLELVSVTYEANREKCLEAGMSQMQVLLPDPEPAELKREDDDDFDADAKAGSGEERESGRRRKRGAAIFVRPPKGVAAGSAMTEMFLLHKEPQSAGLYSLVNKPPTLNPNIGKFTLNFHGRVTKASIKNFQLVEEEVRGDLSSVGSEVLLQFGRVDKDRFTCDFRWPLSPLQAFAIAISKMDCPGL